MSTVQTRLKQPAEVRKITFDFTSKLATGDAVAAVVGNALEAGAGITVSAPTLTGNKVTALVSGGSSTHRISCRVTTTLGETLELDVDVRVVDGEN